MKELFEVLGGYLQNKRVKVGLSQGDVAKRLGYSSPQFISNFERGLCAPPLTKLKGIVNLYNLNGEEVVKLMLKEHERHIRKAIGISKKKK
ncbi:MAG: helix-turn-helix domain-containing protein [Oligoflexia bacterium]|nr:helix-turn-helix domain-containing protein [Oligoflexia bacterium]